MTKSATLEKNAVTFVNLLTPGNFESAKRWLADSCEYKYQNQILKGDAIIRSFSDNHDNASEKVKIEYVDGWVNKVDGQKVFVGIQDKLVVGDRAHIYEDCLAITSNNKSGDGSIEKIEHCPIQEEREKLSQFLESVGVKL